MRMKDKVVLVTGGAAGIGKATALRFAEEGAKVVICDVNEAVGQETLKLLGEGASFYKVNVTSREDVQKWVDDVVAKYGRIDVIVSNAGVLRDGQLVKVKEGNLVGQMSEPDFDLVISVNLKGVFNCAQAVAPVMAKQGGGVILNASSVVGLDANFGQTNYRGGVENHTAALLCHHRGNGLSAIEHTFEIDRDDEVEIRFGHLPDQIAFLHLDQLPVT